MTLNLITLTTDSLRTLFVGHKENSNFCKPGEEGQSPSGAGVVEPFGQSMRGSIAMLARSIWKVSPTASHLEVHLKQLKTRKRNVCPKVVFIMATSISTGRQNMGMMDTANQ